ncbi:hypothetical protein A2954_02620 [Candidatus Roizmanbacteria bacterium RIFCSPLOWO2_01_FULL_37_12]|uniref:Uncharacterized protein n=1 Tax=Candidatus Roizmanbacteria bacterium RIFCSPLOWO2_01_FULL_37_12 TaxID=1802056 RepID=A0A1F7IEY2_9BACT|nr:MAG: hypothetical protein A3D76_02085 [Candidatus Roizmanbacteria bacterium RIFCSPHIGHO2_02_FULL_37_9b]OGK41920.1 MAG: hypothetical protein A2954_02620 [Candidatus Roizmanbacteria bacterium RIFCSPLOWO2_01_FULL_37_12]
MKRNIWPGLALTAFTLMFIFDSPYREINEHIYYEVIKNKPQIQNSSPLNENFWNGLTPQQKEELRERIEIFEIKLQPAPTSLPPRHRS